MHRSKAYDISIVLPDKIEEIESMMTDADILEACCGKLRALAKATVIGRTPRRKRFIRVDLEDPRLSPVREVVAQCALQIKRSVKAASKVDGVTTAESPPATEMRSKITS